MRWRRRWVDQFQIEVAERRERMLSVWERSIGWLRRRGWEMRRERERDSAIL